MNEKSTLYQHVFLGSKNLSKMFPDSIIRENSSVVYNDKLFLTQTKIIDYGFLGTLKNNKRYYFQCSSEDDVTLDVNIDFLTSNGCKLDDFIIMPRYIIKYAILT